MDGETLVSRLQELQDDCEEEFPGVSRILAVLRGLIITGSPRFRTLFDICWGIGLLEQHLEAQANAQAFFKEAIKQRDDDAENISDP